MALDNCLSLLKAAGDPSRLRLLALLTAGEATVGELVEVLGQSQPRVSRHLRILADAQLVRSFRDGHWVYYRLEPAAATAGVVPQLVSLARTREPLLAADQGRMADIRQRRERYAYTAPAGPQHWVEPSAGARPSDAVLAQALTDALGAGPPGDVLDIGVGAGSLLRQLAPRARQAVGLDVSRAMRVLARSRLQGAGLGQATVRAGDMHALPFPDLSYDVVVLDEVLSLSPEPQQALAEAARVLRPAGRLLVLDRIQPAALRLPQAATSRVVIENQLGAMLRAVGLKGGAPNWFPARHPGLAWLTATLAPVAVRSGTDDY
jgi:SAM-dependent methyltransferase